MGELRPLPGESYRSTSMRVRAQPRERVKRWRASKLRIDYYPSAKAVGAIMRYIRGCDGPTTAIDELILIADEALRTHAH